jgi:hypothetical protein
VKTVRTAALHGATSFRHMPIDVAYLKISQPGSIINGITWKDFELQECIAYLNREQDTVYELCIYTETI